MSPVAKRETEGQSRIVHCAWVLSGAPLPQPLPDSRWVPQADKIVVADGGSILAEQLGIVPDLVIGDLDSAPPALVARWQEAGVRFEQHQHHLKAETDTELAVLAALQWQPEQIVVLGAIGGRLDHTLANVLLLTHHALAHANIKIVNGNEDVFIAKPGAWNQVSGRAGDMMTLLPVGGDASGITLEGFEYPLRNETLLRGSGRGVSNRLIADGGRLRLEIGLLLVVVQHESVL